MSKEKVTTLADAREQIQEDVICIMDSQFGEIEYVEEAKTDLCQAVVDNINKVIEGQPPSPMTLALYHGRTDPNVGMEDWGTQGPLLYVDCVLVTYADSIRLQFTGQPDIEFLHEYTESDCFYYDGVYYGDWSIQPKGSFREMGKTPELFEPEKGKQK